MSVGLARVHVILLSVVTHKKKPKKMTENCKICWLLLPFYPLTKYTYSHISHQKSYVYAARYMYVNWCSDALNILSSCEIRIENIAFCSCVRG